MTNVNLTDCSIALKQIIASLILQTEQHLKITTLVDTISTFIEGYGCISKSLLHDLLWCITDHLEVADEMNRQSIENADATKKLLDKVITSHAIFTKH